MTKKLLAPSAFVLTLLLGVYGCSSPDTDTPTAPTRPAAAEDVHHDHDPPGHDGDAPADHDQGVAKTDMEKMTETLASLSSEDRESAVKQHVCPVSGEMLGTMGAPEKVNVKGKAVFICCAGCAKKLAAEPDKYLEILAKNGVTPPTMK